jgi:integrase
VPGRPIVDIDYKPKGKGRKKNKGLIGLPVVLVEPLRQQRERQNLQRMRAGTAWVENDYVFTGNRGQPMNEDALAGAFKRLCKRLGLRVIRLHDLRHGASSLLADTGAKPHETQAILGHSHFDTTMSVYTHAALQAQREALDRVGSLLRADETDV